MLYKYYPCNNYSIDAVSKDYFYFCCADKQNDPYDCSFNLIQSQQFIARLKERGLSDNAQQEMKKYATCSFCRTKDNLNLWANYCNKYNGFVVGFEESELMKMTLELQARLLLYDVDYIDQLIDVDDGNSTFTLSCLDPEMGEKTYTINQALDDKKNLDMFFTYLCCVKYAAAWKVEDEVRMVAAKDVRDRAGNGPIISRHPAWGELHGYKIPFPKKALKEIYVGNQLEEEKRSKIVEIARAHGLEHIGLVECNTPYVISFKDITL